jgi:hypothetical protein
MVSSRGFLLVGALFLLSLINTKPKRFQEFAAILIPFIPAWIIWALWQYYHYLHTGWMGYNPQSQWAQNYQLASLNEVVRNAGLVVWRLLDYGRIAVWISLAGLVFFKGRYVLNSKPLSLLFLATFLLIAVPSLVLVFYRNPIGHRYFIPAQLCGILTLLVFVSGVLKRVQMFLLMGFVLVANLLGPLITYPDRIAKGWDSTYAWVVYTSAVNEVKAELEYRNIPLKKVGSDFPNLYPASATFLNADTNHCKEADLSQDAYVWYSNVFNDFTDGQLDSLKTRYTPIFEKRALTQKMIIYKRNP